MRILKDDMGKKIAELPEYIHMTPEQERECMDFVKRCLYRKEQPMERKVFTYKDVEEARKWIGKDGIFSDSLQCIETGKDFGHSKVVYAKLGAVCDHGFVFVPALRGHNETYQFFSPDPTPVEKWVQFTAEDWREVMAMSVREKPNGIVLRPVSFDGTSVMIIRPIDHPSSGPVMVKTKDLLRSYEQPDGTPCGKKVVE